MTKLPLVLAKQVDDLIDRGFDLANEARSLGKDVGKLAYNAVLPFSEPVRLASNLLVIASHFEELARSILTKVQLEEHRTNLEKTLRARMAVSGNEDHDV